MLLAGQRLNATNASLHRGNHTWTSTSRRLQVNVNATGAAPGNHAQQGVLLFDYDYVVFVVLLMALVGLGLFLRQRKLRTTQPSRLPRRAEEPPHVQLWEAPQAVNPVVVMATAVPIATPAAGESISVADELNKLNDLRSRGIITSSDFEAAKKRLLGV